MVSGGQDAPAGPTRRLQRAQPQRRSRRTFVELRNAGIQATVERSSGSHHSNRDADEMVNVVVGCWSLVVGRCLFFFVGSAPVRSEGRGQVPLRVGCLWIDLQGGLKLADRFVQLSLRTQRDPEVVVRVD